MYFRTRYRVSLLPSLMLLAISLCVAEVEAASRVLPGSYSPSTTLTVTIFLETPIDVAAVGLEDSPPSGWVVSNVTEGGSYDGINGKVKWGPYFWPTFPVSVSYDVTPQANATGEQCFSGVISLDGHNHDIIGDNCISDDCIPDCSGLECGPDPVCGISCGSCDNPLVCVNGTCACIPDCTGRACGDNGCGGSCGVCAPSETCNNATGLCDCVPDCVERFCGPDGCGGVCGECNVQATCDEVNGICVLNDCVASRILSDPVNDYCPGETKMIRLALNIPEGTVAVGIEDTPPPGWFVSDISDGGIYDGVNAKVKWGPFFAPMPSLVTYDVTPSIDKTGLRCFDGTISVDGFNQIICGDECISDAAQGDMNGDSLVNITDWQLFKACLTGPAVAADPACLCRADMNGDGFVDLFDVAIFMTLFTG